MQRQERLLITRPKGQGQHCVDRGDPIKSKRKDCDVVRLTNANSPGPGHEITVIIDTGKAALLFDPPFDASKTLQPGDSLDWTVKATISGTVIMRYRTRPDDCNGADQDDITVSE